MFQGETKNEWANSILFSPRINSLSRDLYDQIELQVAGRNAQPDTFTGIKDEPQRVMRNLNEAVRILSKANARRFLESESLNKFRSFEDFENNDFNSKAPKN